MEPALSHGYDYNTPLPENLQGLADAGFRIVSLGAGRDHSGYHTSEGLAGLTELCKITGLQIHNIHNTIAVDIAWQK